MNSSKTDTWQLLFDNALASFDKKIFFVFDNEKPNLDLSQDA